MAFGGVAIDQVGPVRDYPAASMLTGLIGNAFGWHWSNSAAHQAMQDRMIFGARVEWQESVLVTDVQNVQLAQSDKGWTTGGTPEGRKPSSSYRAPHRRFRDYHAELSLRVVLHLRPADAMPTLDEVAEAIDRPARPLYLGRKPCLPSRPLLAEGADRWIAGSSAYDALCALPGQAASLLPATWPTGEGPEAGQDVDRITDLADLRNWRTGLHAGSRRVVEGWITPAAP